MNILKLSAIVLAACLTVHCGGDDDGGSASQSQIYSGDMNALTKMSASGGKMADAQTNNGFSKIFGGPGGKNVEAYVNERIKHVFNQQDMKNLSLSPSFVGDILGWKEPQETVAEGDAQTIASNDGTALWLISRAFNQPISVINGSQTIPVDSTRVGLVVLGDAYLTTTIKIQVQDENGKVTEEDYTLPAEMRLSTVVHEARHSDCTGGLSKHYANLLKDAQGDLEVFTQLAGIEQLQCGHAHVKCPSGHEYSGHAACDMETWGAYGVGAMFSLAAKYNFSQDSIEYAILDMVHLDEMSRLLKAKHSVNATFGTSSPDMSHSNE